MSIESPADMNGLKAIGGIVARTLRAMASAVRTGITTAEVDAVAARELQAAGAEPSPALVYGFPGIACISVNDEVVHGIAGKRVLEAADVVKLDVTAQKNGYVADAALTVVLPGASEQTTRLAATAQGAFERALRQARAGNRIRDVGGAVQSYVTARGFSVIRALCGHGVGRTIHEPPEVPNFYDSADDQVLTEGLVITIEPLVSSGSGEVYTARDGWTVRTHDGANAAHFEHTIVITRGKPIILTAA